MEEKDNKKNTIFSNWAKLERKVNRLLRKQFGKDVCTIDTWNRECRYGFTCFLDDYPVCEYSIDCNGHDQPYSLYKVFKKDRSNWEIVIQRGIDKGRLQDRVRKLIGCNWTIDVYEFVGNLRCGITMVITSKPRRVVVYKDSYFSSSLHDDIFDGLYANFLEEWNDVLSDKFKEIKTILKEADDNNDINIWEL